jgi:hypothetical protein
MSNSLEAIAISPAEFLQVLGRVTLGMTSGDLVRLFGGRPYSTRPGPDELTTSYWRFLVAKDDPSLPDRYEIYMAEFQEGRMVFGHILPHG